MQMKESYKKVEFWFIGKHLDGVSSVIEQAKVKLLFRMIVTSGIALVLSIPSFFIILPAIGYISFFCLISVMSAPFLIKYIASLETATKILLVSNFFFLAIIHLFLNNPNVLGVGAWYTVIILVAFFILGRKWALSFTIAPIMLMFLMIYFKTIDFAIYDPSFTFSIEDKGVLFGLPFHSLAPFLVIYQILWQFVSAIRVSNEQIMEALDSQCKLYNQLTESENKYRNFIEDADDMIYEMDGLGNVVYSNPTGIELSGYSEKELLSKNLFNHIPEEYQQKIRNFYRTQVVNQEANSYFEFPVINKDGRKIWLGQKVQWSFDTEGNPIKAFCIARDITSQKKNESEIIEAKETAIKASKAKAQFLSSMSHELRTPMNAVIGMTHLLIDSNPREDQFENLKTLQFSAQNLLNLINDILDFSKIEAGKVELENIDFNLLDVATSIRHSLSIKCEEKKLALNLNFADAVPKILVGDPVRIAQVLNNLVSNAIKFTHKGSVDINIKLIEKDHSNAKIYFEVKDTGIGIPEDKLGLIFENFTQADTNTTRNYGGTGLGLAISKQLLELQESKLEVTSKVNQGSSFFFVLDLAVSKLKEDKSKQSIIAGSSNFQSLKGIKVLLVEDNKINQIVARKFLEKWDVEMDVADNGQIGIDLLEKNNYHLVLMDLQMPVMNGFEATRAIRQKGGEFSEIPIIALTASAVMEIQTEAMETGMSDFITKPFEPAQLYSKIRHHATLALITD